ncbi:MAG: branched-chain amino acid ABC transporter permease [bacterium]
MMFMYIDWRSTTPKIVASVFILFFVLFPLYSSNMATLSMIILSGVWAITAMGFALILRTGQFSLGQAGFMAIGGYTSAILTVKIGLGFWTSFIMAGVVAGLVAFLIGMVVLRVGDIYFSIITLSLGEIVRILAQQLEGITNGARGLIPDPPAPFSIFGFEINFYASAVPYYYFMIALVALTALVFWRLGASRLGGTFFSVASNPILAEHQGIYLMKYRVMAFTVSGIFTGFAGAFYANFMSVITPYMLGLWESIQVMIMTIVGGMGSLVAGPIVGAVLLYDLGVYLSRLPVHGIQPMLFGAAVVLVIVFLPKGSGLVDLWTKFWRKFYGESDFEELYEEEV